MLRSKTVQTIRELAAQGHSIRAIAAETGMARNTVRKYLVALLKRRHGRAGSRNWTRSKPRSVSGSRRIGS